MRNWLRVPRSSGRQSSARRPNLEPIERRELLSGSAHPARDRRSNVETIAAEISRYRVFSGSIPAGHGKTFAIQGPMLLGPTDARGQVIGAIYNANGSRDGVVGLVFAGGISLQITTPGGKTLHAAGSGELRRVVGGIPGYDSLEGRGNLATVKGPFILGRWTTTKAT